VPTPATAEQPAAESSGTGKLFRSTSKRESIKIQHLWCRF